MSAIQYNVEVFNRLLHYTVLLFLNNGGNTMLFRMRLFDKVVLFILLTVLIVRAPFIFLPLLIVIYMIYVMGRAMKREDEVKAEKAKKKEMRNRISALEAQIQHLHEVLAESQQSPTEDSNKSS